MANEDAEMIGGISVQIGATHKQLLAVVEESNRVLDALEKRSVTVQIGASGGVAGGGRAAQAPAVRFGAAATTGVQAQQGQAAFYAKVNAELAKTGDIYNAQTGEITKATAATTKHRSAVVAVQQAAAQPATVQIDTASAQNDLNAVLATLREIVATAQQVGSLPAGKVSIGGAGGGSASASVTSHERQVATFSARETAKALRSDAKGLQGLSAQAQAEGAGARTSATFAPPLSQADRAALLSGEARTVSGGSNYRFAVGGSGRGTPPPRGAAAEFAASQRQSEHALDEAERIAGRTRTRRSVEEQIALSRATITAAGRTGRTESSGLAALFGGGQGRLIEARAKLGAADQVVNDATKAALPIYDELRAKEEGIANANAKSLPGLLKAKDAFVHDPRTVAILDKEKTALEGQASALADLNKLQSGGAVLRNLGAITLGGAAFGIGLQAFQFFGAAAEKALGNLIDIQTGFVATSNKVTSALGSQTLALHGNAAQAIATSEAQAGLSTGAASGINPQLTLATQVKAGAFAAVSQQDLIRAALGAGGGAPAGLFGGFGGVLGGPLLAQQLGGGKGFAETIKDQFRDITGTGGAVPGGLFNPLGAIDPLGLRHGGVGSASDRQAALTVAEDSFRDAARRGAIALGQTSDQVVHLGQITKSQADEIAKSNLPQELKDLASQSAEAMFDASGKLVLGLGAATKGLEQAAVGQGIAPVDQIARANLAAEQQRQREAAASLGTIRSQQAYVLPSQIAAIGRQLGFGTGTQLPVQQTLAGLANPNTAVGTGIAPQDRARVAGTLKEAQGLQDQLNAKYQAGQQIIRQTYDPAILKNFGQAAQTEFDTAFGQVVNLGKEIAATQAGISNEQAVYQAHQYNYQLFIAKRSLSDIGGLIGQNLGYGESQYGVLERQNLLLSRQGQELQFILSQRQINFQVAQAGFVVPGVTPEERQANIAEAKLEASYAQKQLDIQKQQFKNQVKLIDIGNLRQGQDLLKQIGLLREGRAVTLDTAAAEAKLQRLSQLQSQQTAKVGQYLSAVDNVVGVAMGNIQTLEAAAGQAMAGIATAVLSQFGIFINGVDNYVSQLAGSGGAAPLPGKNGKAAYASGGVIGLSGPTRIGDNAIAGEAGNETLLILSHPRSASGGGGGVTNIVNFYNPTVSKSSDIDELTRKVIQAMGRQASALGLRTSG